MTTNLFLEKIGSNLDGFMGVFSCDTIPLPDKRILNNLGFSCLISNLSKYDEVGSHFVSIIIKNKEIIYFDPLAQKCTNIFLINYMKKFDNRITIINRPIQDIFSNHCGLYCIALCIEYNAKGSLVQYLKNFYFQSKYLYLNDSIVTKYICKSMKYS